MRFPRPLFCLLTLSSLLLIAHKVRALPVLNNNDCADVLLVFARGSSSNNGHEYLDQPFGDDFKKKEQEAGTFFKKFKTLLDQNYPRVTYKAQSIHDFPGRGSERGYPASGIFSLATANNVINAGVTWWPFGDYQESVNDGVVETTQYIRDEMEKCPDQKIVLGGYSQGADVIAQSVSWLYRPEEREKIAGVALFGDPKFTASDHNRWNPFDKSKPYPWRRGTAGDRATGLLGGRYPYVPDDMTYKTLSWCFDDDFVCSGSSGLVWGGKKRNAEGHSRYATFGVPQAADEIFQRMAPELYDIDKSRGGLDKEDGASQPVPYSPNTKPIDVMFLVDVSYNIDDVIQTLRMQTDNVLPVLNGFFPGVRYGFAYYNELDQYGTMLPRYVIGQQPLPFQPVASPMDSTTLTKNFYRKLAWGETSGGGADVPDPHGLMIEKTSLGTYWDPAAIKHIVLITDRPFKESFTYNICHGSVWGNFNLPNPPNCYTNPTQVKALSYTHPELCDKVWTAITKTECNLNMASPGSIHNITRTLDDAIKVAQSQRTDVTVVIPHGLTGTVTNKPAAEKRMEYFAKATGGLYMKYDVFGRADYTDMLWQVLNHQPKQIALAYKDALDVLGDGQVLSARTSVKARANVPITLDVSQSNLSADTYEWDFNGDGQWDEQTESPNIEHTFTEPTSGQFMRIAAFDGGEEQATATLPLTVESYDGPLPVATVPELPTNLEATELANGDIQITWKGGEPDSTVVIKDPTTGLPIVSLPVEQGSITIPHDYFSGETLLVLAATDSLSSEPQVLEIEQLPIEVINQDELLSIKLNGLSPGETVAGNEVLNTEATTTIQTAPTTIVQTAAVITSPNVLSENTVSVSQTPRQESTSTAVLAEQNTENIEPQNQTQPHMLVILLVMAGGVIAGVWAVKKRKRPTR